ncbi:MAG: DUF1003 domain-containing protein [Peptococcaceae bacterium]|nr:DUF1003 domain-containing protein [Peptococcaceae bacterium]
MSQRRQELIKTILEDKGFTADEDAILTALLREPVAQDSDLLHEGASTLGQRAADGLAQFAGSWRFIFIFFALLASWVVLNTLVMPEPYDSYPFILLNLMLSCLAAIQAPVIMMSQNRQEQKDRLRAKNDYLVNLKAEIIIEAIHEKLDMIVDNQESIVARLSALEGEVAAACTKTQEGSRP